MLIIDESGMARIARLRHDIADESLDTKSKLVDYIGHGRAGRGFLDWPKCGMCNKEVPYLWQYVYGDCECYESLFLCRECAEAIADNLWRKEDEQ